MNKNLLSLTLLCVTTISISPVYSMENDNNNNNYSYFDSIVQYSQQAADLGYNALHTTAQLSGQFIDYTMQSTQQAANESNNPFMVDNRGYLGSALRKVKKSIGYDDTFNRSYIGLETSKNDSENEKSAFAIVALFSGFENKIKMGTLTQDPVLISQITERISAAEWYAQTYTIPALTESIHLINQTHDAKAPACINEYKEVIDAKKILELYTYINADGAQRSRIDHKITDKLSDLLASLDKTKQD